VLAALGVLGLSACGGEEPSGLPLYTPSPSSSSSPSATKSSKWTPEQQQVIDGFNRFTDLQTAFMTKAERVDLARFRRVAKDPFATELTKGISGSIESGWVLKGKVVNTISAVTVVGNVATLKTCQDLTHTKLSTLSAVSKNPPPSPMTISLARQADSWLVAVIKKDEGTCVSG
jgi:hypothetical protein